MLKSSLMDLLRSLSASEIKGLNEYIHSPFFNKNKNVQKLFSYICRLHPEFPPEKMKKEFIYKRLFGTGKFNDGFMRTLIFLITKLAEDYLAYINYSSNAYTPKINLLQELYRRDIRKLLQKNIRIAEAELSEIKLRGGEYFNALQEVESLKNENIIIKGKSLNQKEVSGDLTSNILFNQSVRYFIQAFNHYIFVLNRRHLVNLDTELLLMEELLGHVEKNYSLYSSIPVLMLLYHQVKLNLEPTNEKHYKEVKEILQNNEDSLTYMERYNASIVLQNFCMRLYNSGSSEYLAEYFRFIEFLLKGRYYAEKEGGFFIPQVFKNFVIVAINLKEFEWAEKFIKSFSKMLPPGSRENTLNFSMAKVCFGKGEFEKSLGFISRVSYQDLYYKLEVRYYTLMLYYELSMFSEAFDLVEAYKKYINNNKILSGILRTKHLSFIKYISELLKMRSTGNHKKAIQVEKELRNPRLQVLNLIWLLSKVNDLL